MASKGLQHCMDNSYNSTPFQGPKQNSKYTQSTLGINLTNFIHLYFLHAFIPHISIPSVSAQWHPPATSWATLWPPLRRHPRWVQPLRWAPQPASPRLRARRCNWRRGCNCQPRRICTALFYRCQPVQNCRLVQIKIGNMETEENCFLGACQRSSKTLESCLDHQNQTIRHCVSAPLESGVLQCHGHKCIHPLWCSVPTQSICKGLS